MLSAIQRRFDSPRLCRRIADHLLLTVLLAIPVAAAAQESAEPAILDTFLNGEPRGRLIVEIASDGDVLMSARDFAGLGIGGLEPGAGRLNRDQVSLALLAPDVMYVVDRDALALLITARPDLLGQSTYDLRTNRSSGPLVRSNNAYFNYFVTYGMDENFGFRSLSAPWELGLNVGPVHGQSAFTYTASPGASQLVRNLTTFTWDTPSATRRARFGDVAVATGRLGGAASLGGLSVNSEFSLQPDLVRIPTFEVGSLIETASEVELYVNGSLLRTQRVPPGQLQFVNLQLPSGTSDVVIVIRDDTGREQIIRDVFYFSSRLLRPGLHEYGYAAGFRRNDLGQSSFDYGSFSAGGFHRYGVSADVTLGARLETVDGAVSGGPSIAMTLGNLGEIETGVAYSTHGGASGYAGFLDYRWLRSGLSARASFEGASRDYVTLSSVEQDPLLRQERYRASAGAGYSNQTIGSLSFDATWQKLGDDDWTSTFTGRWTRPLGRRYNLSVGVSRTELPQPDTAVSVALSAFLGGGRTARLSYDRRNDNHEMRAALQQSLPTGRGLSYQLEAARQQPDTGGGKNAGRAFLQYRSRFADLGLDFRANGAQRQTDVRASGSIALVGGSLYLSRPVTQGFAVVDVGGLPGVDVMFRNEHFGTTDRRGRLFIPDLVPYLGNSISVSQRGLPVHIEIEEADRRIATPYRSGGVVGFRVKLRQAIVGRIRMVTDDGESEPELAELRVFRPGLDDLVTIVGRGGEIYLENLPAGDYEIRVTLRGESCQARLEIPDSLDPYVDVGSIPCR